jgi:hypothetical protein
MAQAPARRVDVSGQAVQASFQRFLDEFTLPDGEHFYHALLDVMVENEGKTLMVDYLHLQEVGAPGSCAACCHKPAFWEAPLRYRVNALPRALHRYVDHAAARP